MNATSDGKAEAASVRRMAIGKTDNGWTTASKVGRVSDADFNLFRAVARGLEGAWRDGVWIFQQDEAEVERAFALAGFEVTRGKPAPAGPRGPSTPQEEWAAGALAALSGNDPDYAAKVNGVGFNKYDGVFGHEMAEKVGGGLTDGQWAAVVRLCKKYHRQVGKCPE